jgi:hypothetical protein
MQQIYQAANIVEASIVKGLLEQAGLQAYLNGYYLQGGIGELPATGIASLWVNDHQVEQAQLIIDEYLDQQFVFRG